MKLLEYMEKYEYEKLVYCQDKNSGLKAIICIHDTSLGPALGGTRMWNYSNEEEALIDVLRLARGMTYKAAAAGLNLGGGKAVIIGDPQKDKSEELFRVLGRFIQSLNGRYITAEDVGTSIKDMEWIHMETDYVTGLSLEDGFSGDPSPMTARGVLNGMKAVASEVYGSDSLQRKTVAVQGLGNVGYNLCRYLSEEGAHLIVTDIDKQNVKRVRDEFNAEAVEPQDIYGVKAEIFAPCALGGVINDETIPRFKFDIIAGSANNVLKEERHGEEIHAREILYAPDYVINAGGLINIADELEGYNYGRAVKRVEGIYDNIAKIIELAKRENIPTYKAANHMAEERIRRIGRIKHI